MANAPLSRPTSTSFIVLALMVLESAKSGLFSRSPVRAEFTDMAERLVNFLDLWLSVSLLLTL